MTRKRVDRRTFLKLSGAAITAPGIAACAGTNKVPTEGVPRSRFDDESTAEEVTAGIELGGKIAVVTGCTSGIGYETMRVLAKRGAYVVGTGRSLDKARAACSSVIGKTTPVALELSDFDSVVACAEAIRSMNAPIDILICNAGYLGAGDGTEVINGIEKHFIVNHLGHFVFVNRLLDRLFFAWQGRIVVVASRAAYTSAPDAGIDFDNLDGRYAYKGRSAYGQSKLSNVLFGLQLGKLLRGTRITANSLHPGVINTEIDRNLNRFMQLGFAVMTSLGGGKTVQQGAATSCYVATSPLLGSTSGKYFEDCNAVTVLGNSHMQDEAMAERLWQVSTELCKDFLIEHKQPNRDDFEKGLRNSKSG